MKSTGNGHDPVRMVLHSLLNKLSVIVENCDLLLEKTKQETDYTRQLTVIRDAAETAAQELVEHKYQLEAEGGGR